MFIKHNIDITVSTVPLDTKLSYFNNSTNAGIKTNPAPVENKPFIAPPNILKRIIVIFFILLLFEKKIKVCKKHTFYFK